MTKQQILFEQIFFRIILGFTVCSSLLFAFAHPQVAYLGLLAVSAIFSKQSVRGIEHWFRRFKPFKLYVFVGILSILANLVTNSAASAQWQGAQTAANTALGSYIGAVFRHASVHRCLSAVVLFDYRWPHDLGLQSLSE